MLASATKTCNVLNAFENAFMYTSILVGALKIATSSHVGEPTQGNAISHCRAAIKEEGVEVSLRALSLETLVWIQNVVPGAINYCAGKPKPVAVVDTPM